MPYVCNGVDLSCPSGCADHTVCAVGYHCSGGECQPDLNRGEPCSEDTMCESSACTDGVCCATDDCSPFRCGPDGACLSSCGSSAACAAGHECNSAGSCVPLQPNASDEGGCACRLSAGRPTAPAPWGWWLVAGALVAACRRRAIV